MFEKLRNINLIKLLKLDKLKTPAIIFIVLALFVAVNILVSTFALRLDFSYGRAYTLSTSTKNIIKKLDDGITIKFFASSDLPTRIIPVKNEIIDLLNEYQKTNTGKITVKILDPKKDANALKEANDAGIPELRFSQMESDKYAVTASYFGMAVTYQDKKEIMPQVSDMASLEYNLTAMIYKLTRKETIKIGIIGKEQSYDPQTGDLNYLSQVFSQQFELGYVDLTKEIDPSYKTILIFDSNNKEYSVEEIEAIKKYLDNSGKAIVFVDGVWVSEGLTTSPAKSNLNELLKSYGIKIKNNLVLSTSSELVNFGNSMVQFMSPYPFWLKTNVFNSKQSYFSNINQLTFPWTSSVELKATLDVDTQELVASTKNSWEQIESSSSAIILDPQAIPEPQREDLKPYTLVVESKKKQGGIIMIIPTSRFILDKYLSRTSENLEFILNVVNDYASGGALSGIRQRAVSYYPLPELSASEKDIFKYANMLVLPVLFGLLGGIVLFKRK